MGIPTVSWVGVAMGMGEGTARDTCGFTQPMRLPSGGYNEMMATKGAAATLMIHWVICLSH